MAVLFGLGAVFVGAYLLIYPEKYVSKYHEFLESISRDQPPRYRGSSFLRRYIQLLGIITLLIGVFVLVRIAYAAFQ